MINIKRSDMKKIKILIVFAVALLGSSCKESFFNELPSDQLSEESFFKSSNDFETTLNDGYRLLRTAYANYYVIGDIASDDAYNQKFNNNYNLISINESNVNAENSVVQSIWSGSYQVISRANLVLDKIDAITMDNSLKERYKGEAKFLRSLMYFNLIRIFGDVPLVLTDVKSPQEAFSYSREPVAKVYDVIIADLKDAEGWLPVAYTSNEDIGRATSMAAKSLLGHIYLTRKNYNDGATKFLEVINGNNHRLLDNYSDVFDAAKSNNEEIIFAVQYARGLDPGQGNPFAYAAWPGQSVGDGLLKLANGNFLMTDDLDRAFEEGDQRKLMNNYDFETGYSRRYVFTRKYYDKDMVVKLDAGNDWIVYRYADILLMYAETQNELNMPNEALRYLELVRDRVNLLTDKDLGNSQVLMRSALEKERRVELNCEGHRWFDLVRTDRTIPIMNAHFLDSTLDDDQIGGGGSVEEFELLFPLPSFEVNLNPDKLIQNPGY